MNDLYQQEILNAAKDKKHYGELADADGQSTHYNAACGDKISVQVKFAASSTGQPATKPLDQTIIEDLRWQGEGCVISQAAMSQLSQAVIGKKAGKIRQLTDQDLLDLLQLDSISPGRKSCLRIGLQALQKALG